MWPRKIVVTLDLQRYIQNLVKHFRWILIFVKIVYSRQSLAILHLNIVLNKPFIFIKWKVLCHSVGQDGWCSPPNSLVSRKIDQNCLQASDVTHCVDEYCLFDMVNDEKEERDLSKKKPDVLEEMEQRLSEYRATMVPSRKRYCKDYRASPVYHKGIFEPWL